MPLFVGKTAADLLSNPIRGCKHIAKGGHDRTPAAATKVRSTAGKGQLPAIPLATQGKCRAVRES